MTTLKTNWAVLNPARVTTGIMASTPADGFNGAFQLRLNSMRVNVIASDHLGWEHVSVSLASSLLPPSWSIMAQVKELFWGPDVWVVQFHPAAAEYVNAHPGCLHLWRCLDHPIPTPPSVLVGPITQRSQPTTNQTTP